MDFGGVLGMDGQHLLMSSSSLDHTDNNNNSTIVTTTTDQRSLFGGFLKHGSSSDSYEQQHADWRSLKVGRSCDGEQMLSFSSSSSSSKPPVVTTDNNTALYLNTLDAYSSYQHQYHPPPSSYAATPYYMNAGLGCGSTTNMSRGAFTPSQWVELEHQALVYKYLDSNIPIPSSLLMNIRRSTAPSSISPFLSASYRSNSLGWGPFHLGFSGNADPEPGRCRRTDGKKWRCSRDAVADQKYCERHMNRGRHRSRKHVEGQAGHASKATTAIAASEPVNAVSGGGLSNGTLAISAQQIKSLQPKEPSPTGLNRNQASKGNVSNNNQESDSLFPTLKPHNPFELISTDSGYSKDINRQPDQNPLHHFIDDWSKSHTKSDLPTNLSISIASSPNQDKLALSPLRLSRDSNTENGGTQRQFGWNPISWEPTLGGPLGEVLNNASSSSPSSLNLLAGGWDTSPRMESSPTEVLQKTVFRSLSSSTGSSPRAEAQCDDLLGSAMANPL